MKFKKIMMATAAAATLLMAGAGPASADYYSDRNGYSQSDYDRDHNSDQNRDYGRDGNYSDQNQNWDRDHYRNDNGWHRGWHRHNVVDRWRVYDVVRAHHFRAIGEPYWNRGIYGVRAYSPYGRVVFVRIDPYRGDFIGVNFRF